MSESTSDEKTVEGKSSSHVLELEGRELSSNNEISHTKMESITNLVDEKFKNQKDEEGRGIQEKNEILAPKNEKNISASETNKSKLKEVSEVKKKGARPKSEKIIRIKGEKLETENKNHPALKSNLRKRQSSELQELQSESSKKPINSSSPVQDEETQFCCGDVESGGKSKHEKNKKTKKTRFAREVDVIYFCRDKKGRIVTTGVKREPLADENDQQERSYRRRFKSPVDQVYYPKFFDSVDEIGFNQKGKMHSTPL